MSWRPHGRARVSAIKPEAFATCDRCSLLYNLVDLKWQFQYAGTGTYNTRLKVCYICYDVPSAFLKTIILPADPVPVDQPRPEPYSVDESSDNVWGGGGDWDGGGTWGEGV